MVYMVIKDKDGEREHQQWWLEQIEAAKKVLDKPESSPKADDRAFCSTGKDGGIDNSCSSSEGGGASDSGGSGGRWPKATGALTTAEESAIGDWTNDATTHRQLDEQGKADAVLLSALSKMPRYDGLAYRGMVMSDADAQKFISQGEFEIKGVSSFGNRATGGQYADPHETGNGGTGVLIRTRLVDARDISEGLPSPEYVVRRAKFKVVSVYKQPDGVYLVVADQVDDGEKKKTKRD